ncbi:hypothetical protein JW960_12915 [candidate division KSB1 bacterium]|nr:hypothetical protein [candidate division KSB1 bacterium]
MEEIIKEYDAILNDKKSLTIQDSKFRNYHVAEFNDGTLVLKPKMLVHDDEISENTLRMMDQAITN